jgi:hypothetical protein
MTSSIPKYNTTGIPYEQHSLSSCRSTGFGNINNFSPCGNINISALQSTFLAMAASLYLGGSGISIDRSGLNPIINWDPSSISDIGNCVTPLNLKGNVITYGSGEHIFSICTGALLPNTIVNLGDQTLANVIKQTSLSIGPVQEYSDLVDPDTEQYGVPLVFSENSKTPAGVDNDMTFIMGPYQKNEGGILTKGIIISRVDISGGAIPMVIFTQP